MQNKSILITRARYLRKNSSMAENKLWYFLKRRHLANLRFRRQVPVGNYIADFVCHELKLIIELDGSQHATLKAMLYDQRRTLWLESQGYLIRRYWNNEVLENSDAVLDDILRIVESRVIGLKNGPFCKKGVKRELQTQ